MNKTLEKFLDSLSDDEITELKKMVDSGEVRKELSGKIKPVSN